MRRTLLVFVGAVLLPGLALGWLALRSVRQQEAVLDRQRRLLHQAAADDLARGVAARVNDVQRDFSLAVESLLGKDDPHALAREFDDRLRSRWPLAAVGFAVLLDGKVLSPVILGRPEARQFLVCNENFLCQKASVEVFAVTPKGRINLADLDRLAVAVQKGTEKGTEAARPASGPARFAQIVGDAQEGLLARFLEDELRLWLWYRTAREPDVVFGAQLDLVQLRADLAAVVAAAVPPASGVALALLDDRDAPVAVVPPGIIVDWRRPVVDSSLGELLPHWRSAVAVYHPGAVRTEVTRLRWLLAAGVLFLLGVMGVGGWVVVNGARRQLELARQKTDFVSNVSHELRTPLTSIRLFAEMLADGRVSDPQKHRQHLGIIQAEAARLNRLIANVLDFSRLERGEKKFARQPVDLGAVAQEVVDSFQPQLAAEDIETSLQTPDRPLVTQGDPDALAQVLTNLLSNAIKYAASGREITVRLVHENGTAMIDVLDRGPGVPHGCEERIFEQFFRVHDALSSGIPGAGLGLTLARQVARAHGGDVTYTGRAGGGSCFRVVLPIRPCPGASERLSEGSAQKGARARDEQPGSVSA